MPKSIKLKVRVNPKAKKNKKKSRSMTGKVRKATRNPRIVVTSTDSARTGNFLVRNPSMRTGQSISYATAPPSSRCGGNTGVLVTVDLGAIIFRRDSTNAYVCFYDGSTAFQSLSLNPLWTSGTSIGPMFTGTAFNNVFKLFTHYYCEKLGGLYTPTGGKTEPGTAVICWRDANDLTLDSFTKLASTNGSVTFPLCEEKRFTFFSEKPRDPQLFFVDPTNDSSTLKTLVTPGVLLAATDALQATSPKEMGRLRFHATFRLYELQGDPAPALVEDDSKILAIRQERQRVRNVEKEIEKVRTKLLEAKEAKIDEKSKEIEPPKLDREVYCDYVTVSSTSSNGTSATNSVSSKNQKRS